MSAFEYRGVRADGATARGRVDADDHSRAVAKIRALGVVPVEITAKADAPETPIKLKAATRTRALSAIAELAVLLRAGLALDRALSLVVENTDDRPTQAIYLAILAEVREGRTLSAAMDEQPGIFPPAAIAMTEAGEANGQLSGALARLAAMLEQAESLRRTIATSLIYPIALTIIAVSVILLMLLFVVPQFETVFATAKGQLPASSRFVMGASRGLRENGLILLGLLAAFGAMVRLLSQRPAVRRWWDAIVLRIPQVGTVTRNIETARFARTLGILIDSNVPLPAALALARRTISNSYMGQAIEHVSRGLKEGGGLTAPLAAANVLPRMAIGFLRTGEESSQLGPMLERLAEVLDRDVSVRLQRLIGIATPTITVVMGAMVAGIIASIMSAILGFNDLAIAQ
jgi:general secretion pathway protein F